MDKLKSDFRTYPMKQHWQTANRVLGLWSWLIAFGAIVGTLGLALIFQWARKVVPAFRKIMAGERASYLRTSAQGLTYRLWPFWEIRSGWGDLKSLHRGRLLGDALYLQPTEAIGFPEFAIMLGQPQIHLSSLMGWPDGGLEDELRKFAPQLFGE